MDNFNSDLNSVLRYSMNTVENLLHQLQQPEHNQTRWGHPDRSDFRGIVADSLSDADREKEAELLRNPQQHVMVVDGRIRPAQFVGSHIGRAAYALDDFIGQHSPDGRTPDIGWSFPVGSHRTGSSRLNTTGFADDADTVHMSDAGSHLADAYENDLEHHPLTINGSGEASALAEHLHSLRNAPYEEIDHKHPSEDERRRSLPIVWDADKKS